MRASGLDLLLSGTVAAVVGRGLSGSLDECREVHGPFSIGSSKSLGDDLHSLLERAHLLMAVLELDESHQVHDLENDEGSKDRADAEAVRLLLVFLRHAFSLLLAPNFGSEGLEKLILDLLLFILLLCLRSSLRNGLGELVVNDVADLGALAVTITAGLLLKRIDLIVEVVRADLPATGRRLRAAEIIVVLLIEHGLASSLQALLLARGNDFVERAANSLLLVVGVGDEVHTRIAFEDFLIVLGLGRSINQSGLLLNWLRDDRAVTHLHVHHGVELLVHGSEHLIEIFLRGELEIEHLVHLIHLLEHLLKILIGHRTERNLELLKVAVAHAVVAFVIVPGETLLMMRVFAVVAMESLIVMRVLTSLIVRFVTVSMSFSMLMLVVRRVHGRNLEVVSRDSLIVGKLFSDVHDLVGLVSHRTVSDHEENESDHALAEVELDVAQVLGLGSAFGALCITKEHKSENDKESSRHEHAVVKQEVSLSGRDSLSITHNILEVLWLGSPGDLAL